MEKPVVLGIDIGGSHITAALVDLDTRTIVPGSGKRKSVNAQDQAENIFDSWCTVISEAFETLDVKEKKIGIAMPGPFDYETGVSLIQDQDKFKSLYKLNLKNEIADRLAIDAESIRFINDAASFLQGEQFGGAARGYNNVIGLTLGTGLGSAVCFNGTAEDADLWNSPFKDGIAEDYLSSRWFTTRFEELTGEKAEGVKEILQMIEHSTPIKQLFTEFSRNLAAFLVPLVQKHGSEVIVVGGNISNASERFVPELLACLSAAEVFAEVRIANLKEDASLIGAASCWENDYSKNHMNL